MKKCRKKYTAPEIIPLSRIISEAECNGEGCSGGSSPSTSSCAYGDSPETCVVGSFIGEAG